MTDKIDKKEVLETNNNETPQQTEANSTENPHDIDKESLTCVLNNFYIDENDIAELEKIDDDFAPEIKAEKIKIEEEEKKKKGELEGETQQNMELEPLKNDTKLEDIAELDSTNIEEFLKKNKKLFEQSLEESKTENKVAQANVDNDVCSQALNTFKLNESLWKDLDFSNETKEKILNNVKSEIKEFCKNNLAQILEKKGK